MFVVHPNFGVSITGGSQPMSNLLHRGRARARVHRRALAMTVAVLVGASAAACSTTPVPQPTPPALGSHGPCTSTATNLTNPDVPGNVINVFTPTGSAATPFTGGTCGDASRPVVFVVHGWLAAGSWLYQGIIDHLVSQGNVVVFGTYANDILNVPLSADNADAQIVYAGSRLGARADLERVGVIGHSLGGGITPLLTQRMVARGWGSTGLWLFPLAPFQTLPAGTAPITLPSHARAVVEAYDGDTLVDNAVGIAMFHRLTVPASQKQHVTVRTSSNGAARLDAVHTSPNSVIAPDDAVKFYGIYRIADALQSCALLNQNCNADLSLMGNWPDGSAVLPSVSTDNPTPL